MKHQLFSVCLLLSLALTLLVVQPAAAIAGVWTPTGSMIDPHRFHTTTLLANGSVLVAGGRNNEANLASAELYDPATGQWTATGSMATARNGHTATLLPLAGGKVFVAGGIDLFWNVRTSAELYDPATGRWTSAGSMSARRYLHTATLLANGKVLVSGGKATSGSVPCSSAELYDPATNTWFTTGSMNAARIGHIAVRLLSGKVLVVGGWDGINYMTSAELYDPATGQWTSTGALHTGRFEHTATLLSNGKVLVVGGNDHYNGLTSAEIYDPVTGLWTMTGSLTTGRRMHAATLLSDGKVLVSGGVNRVDGYLGSVELYDPVTGTWTATSSLLTARSDHGAVLLANANVLITGGTMSRGNLDSAEIYSSNQGVSLRSGGAQDGWVLETSENSNQGGTTNTTAETFLLGDHASKRQYRSILSFNTSSLPDSAIITRAVLKIKKQSVIGMDPFTTHRKIAVDIQRGAFSNAAALQPTDFQDTASQPLVALIGNNPTAGGWYIVRLNATAHPFINLRGVTQLRLGFQTDDDNDAVADFIRFYSGNAAAANRPVLVMDYHVP